ncbi:hypothetical protein [Desulfitobacterium sp. AusDCA]|uniref:hypothetical protein n=1 Tax=Desulfitobacterium sp. AusDCA TaxID=3240383 RepID=UPI003DA72763
MELKEKITSFVVGENKYNSGVDTVMFITVWEKIEKNTVPPQSSCEKCGGEMYPEYYKGLHGNEYEISDVRGQ